MDFPAGFNRRARASGACLICAQPCGSRLNLCQHCARELPYMGCCCIQCGEAHKAESLYQDRCGRCQAQPPQVDACLPVFHYASPVDSLLTAFKFRGRFAHGFALAELMALHTGQQLVNRQLPQLLVPVPLHWRRLQQRGFNQSWLLCKAISRHLGIPAEVAAVVKQRHTTPQSELRLAARRRQNLRGAFTLRPGHRLEDVKHIAIIDDVVTTLSTANELARMLRSHGIRRVELWCLARARR